MPNLFRMHELLFLMRHLKIRKDDRLLDVACGIGVYSDWLANKAACVVGFDLSYDSILLANCISKENTFYYRCNAEEISHPDSTFDIVVSICVLEHLNDSKKALREMFRVLKPGGQLLITVDSLENINSKEFIEFHRKFCLVNKYFTVDTILKELEEAGFEIKDIKPILTSVLSSALCRLAFKIMKWPLIFIVYSLVMFPLSLISDMIASDKRSGIIICSYALKPLTA